MSDTTYLRCKPRMFMCQRSPISVGSNNSDIALDCRSRMKEFVEQMLACCFSDCFCRHCYGYCNVHKTQTGLNSVCVTYSYCRNCLTNIQQCLLMLYLQLHVTADQRAWGPCRHCLFYRCPATDKKQCLHVGNPMKNIPAAVRYPTSDYVVGFPKTKVFS